MKPWISTSARCYPKCLFFFFQAEDGIRDVAVTGVQTCALPISSGGRVLTGARSERRGRVFADPCDRRVPPHSPRVGSGPRVAAGCAYRAPEWRHGGARRGPVPRGPPRLRRPRRPPRRGSALPPPPPRWIDRG